MICANACRVVPLAVLAICLGCHAKPAALKKASRGNKSPQADRVFSDEATVSLCRAIESHDRATFGRLIVNVNVNARGQGGATPLLWALIYDRFEFFEALLIQGADPNAIITGADALGRGVRAGNAVTHLVCMKPDTAYFNAVFAHGGDPNLRIQGKVLGAGDTPLFCVIQEDVNDKQQRIATLIGRGADINYVCPSFLTPVSTAVASHGQYDVALMLLEAGADYKSFIRPNSNQRLIHLVLDDGYRRSRAWRERQARDYQRLLDWLVAHGDSLEVARAEMAEW
ncbi:MAG: hypothetical protein K1X74_13630 [Pirellulales bacterium]|nr:hypothetical protein [Pirellulales bacterium]